jgi:hypothetical protein
MIVDNRRHQRIYIYKHGTGNISRFLNKPLHEHVVPTPLILIVLLWSKKTLPILVKVHPKIVPCFINE